MPCAKSAACACLVVSLLICFSSRSNSGLEYRGEVQDPPVFRHISQPGPGIHDGRAILRLHHHVEGALSSSPR